MPRLDRVLLEQTNHGRSEGWDVELDGRVIAYLDEPQWEDMFWVSYRITPVTDDAALAAQLLSEEFWRGEGWQSVRFRSRAVGLIAPNAFPAVGPLLAPARVNMRGLYLTTDSADPPASEPRDTPPGPPVGVIHRLRSLLCRFTR